MATETGQSQQTNADAPVAVEQALSDRVQPLGEPQAKLAARHPK
jgi:hypothetical protein